MIIREAKNEDIPAIVKVLKLSLGEQELPLSEFIWIYKHVYNPFGKSIVLIAKDENHIVGVRALMRWKWQLNGKIHESLRAVDTATHPEYQGKGIFKKLTLDAVKVAQANGDSFIFNTPNDQSRPGYLKMGWEKVDQLKVALKPAYNSFWKISKRNTNYEINLNCSSDSIDNLCRKWNQELQSRNTLFTPKSAMFLAWRYENNPLQKYEVIAEEGIYLAAYIKKRKGIRELRISECIFNRDKKWDYNKLISKLSNKFKAQVISYSPDLLDLKGNLINSNIGPVLTLKELNLNKKENLHLKDISNWNYSIGDLELF